MSLLQFSHLELGLAGLTALLFLIVLLYCLVLYRRPWKCRIQYEPVKQDSSSCPPVSVVVYAQDNEENLEQHLPALLNQNYPEFEVIVVNDGISEACSNRLSLFKRDYPYLYYTFIPKDARYISKKKLALTLGIKAARHQVILFTEADCEPLSENWIRTMVESYQQKTEVVLGYAAYPYQKGWINQLIAYDNLKSGLQYLSAALLGNPFSGSGKNLSYTKDLFFKNKGFYNQLYLKIGEDNQFVNEVATSQNTLVNYSPEALVKKGEYFRLKKWSQERIGSISTRSHSKNHFYRLFLFENLCYWLFWITVITSVIVGCVGNFLLSVYAGFLFICYYVVKGYYFIQSSRMLAQRISFINFFPLDVAENVYNLYLDIVSCFRKKQNYVFLIEK